MPARPHRQACRAALAVSLAACSGHGPASPADRPPEPAATAPDRPSPAPSPAPPPVGATLALGVSHSCALVRGQVLCWGYGGHGELGDGARLDRPAPTPVPGLDDVVAVTAGIWHTCALRAGGEVLCWGDGALGQLGDGALGTRPSPAPIPDLRATAIAAGDTHTCAIDHDRKVLCWGSNHRGESGAGDGPRARPTVVDGLPPATALAAGDSFSCALASGEAWCWGRDPLRDGRDPTPARVAGISGALELAAGDGHACARLGDGRVLCFGTGAKGQLGDGRPPDMVPSRSPHAPPHARPRLAEVADLDDARAIAVGGSFACALRQSGAVTCWGEGRSGELGDGAPPREDGRNTPAPVAGLDDVVELAAGSAHACARLTSGALRCWGYNEFGQAGPVETPRPVPMMSHALAATRVTVGDAHACAWSDDGAWCWGDNTYGQLGDGTRTRSDAPVRLPGLGRPRELVAGARHTCSLDHGGTVLCWGDDTFGQLASPGRPHGEPRDRHRGPAPLPPIDTRSRPRPGPVAGLDDVIDLAVHVHHTCALRRAGDVVCWHAWEDRPLARTRALPGAVELALGGAHGCARLGSGEVRCWGTNHTGRLGDGTTAPRDGEVTVLGLRDAVALAAGRLHTCALRRTGAVVCWGDGYTGQLGDGARADRPALTAVAGLAGVTALATGCDSTCAIDQGRKVLCWGNNDAGQLGDDTHGRRVVPVPAAVAGATAIAVGETSACAVTDAGAVTCWGEGLAPSAPRVWDVAATPRAVELP